MRRPATGRRRARKDPANGKGWKLRRYVAGQTPRSVAAIENLKRICVEHIGEHCHVEVVDLVKNPRLARDDQILAIPTLIRKIPGPARKIIGDLSDVERVLVGLDVRTSRASHAAR